jgi:aspartyl-tRNA(Asn)/glutamyl-tRNA(Gln) amidotransferase subunit A
VTEDPCSLTAADLAAALRRREVSPVEVVEAVHRRMDRLEPRLHAFCHRADEQALEAARALDRDLANGAAGGPLCGVPIGIKDLVAVAGMPMPGGSPAYRDFVPDEDDVVVERVRAAGAIVLGKTAVTEFGYSGASHSPVGETVRNPWNLALTSGGSSAGSGAAVAAGMGPVAIAADGGGSIRIPASLCGLFGMKASMGRVPMYPSCRDERHPGIGSWEGLEHVGPVSRTVADSALVPSVIAGPDDRDRHSIPAGDSTGPPPRSPATCAGCASPTAPTSAESPSTRRSSGSSARPWARSPSWAARSSVPTPASRTRAPRSPR